jgi:hypothetical protein
MEVEEFFKIARQENSVITLPDINDLRAKKLSNEALFQLPFLSMVVLYISKGSTKPNVQELGQIIGECFERSFSAFKGSPQHLGWSANMRVRTVSALSFLEIAQLVKIEHRKSKVVITELGRKIIDNVIGNNTDLSENLRVVARNYGYIKKESKMRERV